MQHRVLYAAMMDTDDGTHHTVRTHRQCAMRPSLEHGLSLLWSADNAGVIVNPKGEMKGSAITGAQSACSMCCDLLVLSLPCAVANQY